MDRAIHLVYSNCNNANSGRGRCEAVDTRGNWRTTGDSAISGEALAADWRSCASPADTIHRSVLDAEDSEHGITARSANLGNAADESTQSQHRLRILGRGQNGRLRPSLP